MEKKLHIVMYPWLHMGHIIPYLHLANHLAERGHKTTLFAPKKAIANLHPLNLHSSLIYLHPITVPHVDSLPPGTETASDIPMHLVSRLTTAMDLTRPELESAIGRLQPKPDFLFYDMAYWVPEIASKLGAKSVCYEPVAAACSAIILAYAQIRRSNPDKAGTGMMPPEYPSSDVVLRGPAEWGNLLRVTTPDFGSGITFRERVMKASNSCDAKALRTCKEIEGRFYEYISSQTNKPILLTGPVLPEPTNSPLDPKWAEWLGRFDPGSVVFCSFGSQVTLEKGQLQELLLGFEMTQMPFLVAVPRLPTGCATVTEALPEGFEERVGDRGVVHGGAWIPQPQILNHPSVGCFVSHCGFGAMWESLLSECQIVVVPPIWDHVINARIMAAQMKVAVEVERESNGWFSKEKLCEAIKAAMDEGSEVGGLIKKNHAKWRGVLSAQGFMSGYVDNFVKDLKSLVS